MGIVQLVELECGTCGVCHCIPQSLYNKCKEEGGFWHCPNGHSRGFHEGSIRKERDRLKQQLAQKEDEIREEQTKRAEVERQMKRMQKRAKAGVCPCCNRTFTSMARHMQTKHPEFEAADPKVVPLRIPETGRKGGKSRP